MLRLEGFRSRCQGKERDTETSNDDFAARYYSWRFGRWLSADWSNVPIAVPYANLSNPQTLNLYSMVADDPETFADLDGHEDKTCGANGVCTTKDDATTLSPYQRYMQQETAPATDDGRLNALSSAGNEAQVGVNWAMVATSPQYALMAAVGVAEVAPAVSSATNTVTTAVNDASLNVYVKGSNTVSGIVDAGVSELQRGSTLVGGVIASRGGPAAAAKEAGDFVRGVVSNSSIPTSEAGLAGRGFRAAYEIVKRLLF